MTTDLPQIQKFNGDNFHLWKFQMKIILEAKDLLSITDGSEVKPEIEDIAKFSNWKKKDAKSKMLITTALKFKYLQQIVNCQTSTEMWKKLSTIYELKSETNKYLLQQRFFEYKMNPNDNIATHISKVETLAQQMKDLGEPISDVALITKIICSLPDKYKNFITAWDSVSSEEKTLENLTARLLKEESLQDHWDYSGKFKPDNALMTFSKFNRNSTASNKQQQHQQSIKDKKKNTHCGYCKKKGHWWKECYKRKEEQKGQQPSSSSRDDSCAFSAETSAFLAETKDSWIADSGATDHMTFRREWFSTFEEIPEGVHPVCLGDGKKIYAKGIVHELTAPYTPEQNGISERDNRTIVESARCLLHGRKMPLELWAEAVNTAVYLLNRCTTKVLGNSTPYEIWYKRKPSILHLKTFGCNAYVHIPKDNRKKLDKKSIRTFFVGYTETNKNYRMWDPIARKIIISRDVIFTEANMSENIQDNQQEQVTIYSEESVDSTNTSSKPEESCRYPLRNRIREKEQSSTSCTRAISYACYVHDQEPLNYEDAIVGQDSKQWKLAMDDEFNSLMKNQTWTYVTLPSDRKAIACKYKALLIESQLPPKFWAEAMNTYSYIKNRTPEELFTRKKPTIKHLKVFGCRAEYWIPKFKRYKFEKITKSGIFVGYSNKRKAFRICDPKNYAITETRDVSFIEKEKGAELLSNEVKAELPEHVLIDLNFCHKNGQKDDEPIPIHQGNVPESTSNEPDEDKNVYNLRPTPEQGFYYEPPLSDEDTSQDDTTSDPTYHPVDSVMKVDSLPIIPTNYEETINSPDKEKWVQAMKGEIDSLNNHKVWDVLPMTKTIKPIKSKWGFSIKNSHDPLNPIYKARFDAVECSQKLGVDYSETYSPVIKSDSLRTLIAFAAMKNLHIHHFDIETAFLYGKLEENIYMSQPKGFEYQEEALKTNPTRVGLPFDLHFRSSTRR
ncbi:hypothetical protein LAZ67_1004107 [Cordylochernes scorpioides]|uniref:Integrase catalytic domain-containing protein n=1 Tax=Cordylochernes scorpioides TaxID=51811 RepID=A0ABY6K0A6_9ARAC|nr:hypothetical protein LAZ67_1004107 [Cordylochernes scorpioides]